MSHLIKHLPIYFSQQALSDVDCIALKQVGYMQQEPLWEQIQVHPG